MNPDTKVRVGVAAIVWREGKFLVGKRLGSHGKGSWSVPGGHLEASESWEACASRETLEETGMQIRNVRFLAVTNDIFEAENKHYVTIWMEAEWQANEPAIMEPDKLVELAWVDFGSLPAPLFSPCWDNLRAVKPELFISSPSQQR